MNNNQGSITRLRDIPEFSDAVMWLAEGKELSNSQIDTILSAAIILVKDYENHRDHIQSLEFAYWIVLRYALVSYDFQPLFDFAIEFGLYPICKAIDAMVDEDKSLMHELSIVSIQNHFRLGDHIQTIEQANRAHHFSLSSQYGLAYIAPTSFGKTELVIHNALSSECGKRVCIVVPTKSLLNQTARSVRKEKPQRKILVHDEMYSKEDAFIGVLTQERAMRLLEANPSLHFDSLFIDEAHHLFSSDGRALLLSRLIRLSIRRNPDTKIAFLSPVVSNTGYFAAITGKRIEELRIRFNMKEPEFLLRKRNGDFLVYNRFLDQYAKCNQYPDIWKCIRKESAAKNLVYVLSPRKIQVFAAQLASELPFIEQTPELDELINMLTKYVHPEYDIVELAKHGVLYLHGQMPDGIKDYVEYKYSMIQGIRFVVANTVVLEGVNLPIDGVFILSTRELNKRNLINLIGRASRLNRVFGSDVDLNKLMPKIVFLDNDEFDRKNGKMENTLKKIRTSIFDDEINNPLIKRKEGIVLSDTEKKILEVEDYLEEEHLEDFDKFKSRLFQLGISQYYALNDKLVKELFARIKEAPTMEQDIFETIYQLFINNLENSIKELNFLRLRNQEARNYYSVFLADRNAYPLNKRLARTVAYFKERAKSNNPKMYVGKSFGEIAESDSQFFNVYVDLSKKTVAEFVGLAIAKLQNEENYLRYDLMRFVELLKEYSVISDSKYNLFVYGTNDVSKIEFCRLGLPLPLINRLSDDNQLRNIKIDDAGNVQANAQLNQYISKLDDLTSFTVKKYLS